MKPRKSRTGEGGFTLLELLVTLTIASLLLTVAAPRLIDTVAHARLKASAAQISVALKEIRSAAMKSSQPASLVINAASRSYSTAGKQIVLPTGQTLWLAHQGQVVEAGQASLDFLPDGSSNGGTLTIANGSDHVHVDVDWLTGRVSWGE